MDMNNVSVVPVSKKNVDKFILKCSDLKKLGVLEGLPLSKEWRTTNANQISINNKQHLLYLYYILLGA